MYKRRDKVDKVKCDECQTLFTIKTKSKKVGIYKGNAVRFNYFACSACKKNYFIGVKEKELDKIIAKLRRLQRKLGTFIGSGNVDEFERLNNECGQLKAEIKVYSNTLKNMFKLK